MLKVEWNRRYMTIAVYAFLVLAAVITAAALLLRLGSFLHYVNMFFSLLSPAVYGLVIAYFINPVMKFCERTPLCFIKRQRLRRWLAITLAYIMVFMFIALLLLMVLPQIISNYGKLVSALSGFFNNTADSFNRWFISLQEDLRFESDFRLNFKTLTALISSYSESTNLATLPVTVLQRILRVLVSMFLSVFILARKEGLSLATRRFFAALLPCHTYHLFIRMVKRADRTFGRFFLGKIFDSLIIGVISFLILWILHLCTGGMRYYAVISLIIGVTNVIPYFGPFIGAIPSFIIVLTDNIPMAFLLLLIILIIQQIDGNLIGPTILGQAIGMDSLWIIISITVMSGLLGVLGMFIGVPLFSIIYTGIKYLVERRLHRRGMPTETSAYVPMFAVGETYASVPQQSATWDQTSEGGHDNGSSEESR